MTDAMINPLAELRTAMMFLTRFPVGTGNAPLASASWAFPVAGAFVGLIAGIVYWIAGAVGLPGLPAAFLTLIASALATGAMHEDGLADAADGLFVYGTPERRLEIMRDSRTGGFGALALILMTGLKASCIAVLPMDATGLLALVSVHALARAPLSGVMTLLPPASRTGLAATAGAPNWRIAVVALGLGSMVAAGCIGFNFGPAVALVSILGVIGITTCIALYCRRAIGGHNGDTLGAMEQVAEATILLVLVTA